MDISHVTRNPEVTWLRLSCMFSELPQLMYHMDAFGIQLHSDVARRRTDAFEFGYNDALDKNAPYSRLENIKTLNFNEKAILSRYYMAGYRKAEMDILEPFAKTPKTKELLEKTKRACNGMVFDTLSEDPESTKSREMKGMVTDFIIHLA